MWKFASILFISLLITEAKADGQFDAFRSMTYDQKEIYIVGYLDAYLDLDAFAASKGMPRVLNCPDKLTLKEATALMLMKLRRSETGTLRVARINALHALCGAKR